MKIIDLLNKIANGEEVQQFEYYGGTYRKSKKDNRYWYNGMWFAFDIDVLNDEVEIIEEEKKITPKDFENLGYALGSIKKYINKGYDKAIEEKKIPEKLPIYDCTDAYSKFDINDNRKAINELIDYLKSKGE